jgi:hypothetical protein
MGATIIAFGPQRFGPYLEDDFGPAVGVRMEHERDLPHTDCTQKPISAPLAITTHHSQW